MACNCNKKGNIKTTNNSVSQPKKEAKPLPLVTTKKAVQVDKLKISKRS